MPTAVSSGDWAIGHNLHITTTTGQAHSGTLLINDPISQTIVLSSPARTSNGVDTPPPQGQQLCDLQIIKVSSIKEIRVLSQIKPEGFKPYEPRPLTVEAIKAREEAAAKRVVEEERRLGVGVSLDGQRIYDAFAKTLPVKWVDKSILVAEQALINPPYTVESVVSVTSVLNGGTEDNGKSALLTRVKHVLHQERVRLGINSIAKVPVEGIRKGG